MLNSINKAYSLVTQAAGLLAATRNALHISVNFESGLNTIKSGRQLTIQALLETKKEIDKAIRELKKKK